MLASSIFRRVLESWQLEDLFLAYGWGKKKSTWRRDNWSKDKIQTNESFRKLVEMIDPNVQNIVSNSSIKRGSSFLGLYFHGIAFQYIRKKHFLNRLIFSCKPRYHECRFWYYRYTDDSIYVISVTVSVQFITIILLTLETEPLGFLSLIELEGVFCPIRHVLISFVFSLFKKLTSVTFFPLIVGGTIFVLPFWEINGFFKGKNLHDHRSFSSLFMSSNTRLAALATHDCDDLEPTLCCWAYWMLQWSLPKFSRGRNPDSYTGHHDSILWNFMRGRRS